MRHTHTERVLQEWRRRRTPGRALPERTALSPLLLAGLSPQMSVLAREPNGWRFRTAGALLEDLHGRPLAGTPFVELWSEADRPALARGLDRALGSAEPWVVRCRGETQRGRVAFLEITLAPVTGPLGAADRCVGLHQPLSPLHRLEGEPLTVLRLGRATEGAGPRLVVDNTRPPPLG